ncbi:MAG: glucosyltransferase domain-containing protein [Clostridia bacterium]
MKNKRRKYLYISAPFVLILNQYTLLEYLLFPESAVMYLGMLFTVLAIKNFVSDSKYKYLKTGIFLLLTGLSYQGELNIFPILAILVIMLKQIKDKKKIKISLKDALKDFAKLVGITIIALAISYVIVKVCGNIFGQDKQSFMIINNARVFRRKLNLVLYYSKDILINCISMFPKYSILICSIITLILLIRTKAKLQTILNYIVLVIIAVLSVVLPLFVVTAAVCGRLSIPVMMIFGISLLFLIANLKDDEVKYKQKIISIVVICIFILNASFIVINSTEHIAANKVDENDGMQIRYLIEEYEKNTGIKVTKFGYINMI